MQLLSTRNLIAICILLIAPSEVLLSQLKKVSLETDLFATLDVQRIVPLGVLPDINANRSSFNKKTLNGYNIKAVRDFKKRYTDVTDEKWIETKEGYLVMFCSDNMTTKVRYTTSGNWINSIKRYNELNLEEEIKAMVKPGFYNDSIVVIYELSAADLKHTVYYLHVKDADRYRIVKLEDGQMEEVQSFKIQHSK